MLLPAEAAWMRAGVFPPNALMRCENLTGDAERISLAHVFVCKAEEMQLRRSWNYSRSVLGLWAGVRYLWRYARPSSALAFALCNNFQWGRAGRAVTVSLTLPVFIWRILNSRGHVWGFVCLFDLGFCVCVCTCFSTSVLVPKHWMPWVHMNLLKYSVSAMWCFTKSSLSI